MASGIIILACFKEAEGFLRKIVSIWKALPEFIFCLGFLFSNHLLGSPDVCIKRKGCVAQKCQLEPSLGSS